MRFKLRRLLHPSPVLAAFLASGLFLLFLAITAPAKQTAGWLGRLAPNLYLEGISGSLWNGNAELAAVRLGGQWLSLGRLQWHLSPASLLFARLQLQVAASASDRELSGTVSATLGGSLLLRDVQVLSNAVLFSPWLPAGMDAAGETTMRIRNLRWSGELLAADASVGWQNAQLNMRGGSLLLGNLAADLRRDESGYLLAALEDFGGPLEVLGTLWYGGGAAGISARMRPRKEADELLRGRLRDLAGAPQEDASFLLNFIWPPGSDARPPNLVPPEMLHLQAAVQSAGQPPPAAAAPVPSTPAAAAGADAPLLPAALSTATETAPGVPQAAAETPAPQPAAAAAGSPPAASAATENPVPSASSQPPAPSQ